MTSPTSDDTPAPRAAEEGPLAADGRPRPRVDLEYVVWVLLGVIAGIVASAVLLSAWWWLFLRSAANWSA